ncbi:MAG: ATP-binding cassette domain-containing protein [Bryobacteraceae bacterium]|nr:ATP-binding cassette domain-containing protein [Bryobacteraceae bacterium]
MTAGARVAPQVPIVSVDNISLHFGGIHALENVTFHIDAGEFVGLVGANGAGKSSLLNCLVGYYPWSAGDIRVSGQSIRGWRPHRVAALGVGRTFQHVGHLQSFTVREAMQLGADAALPGVTGLSADAVIEHLGLAGALNTPLTELDYGTQKMADIARVVMMRPRLLLLDEPTSGIDDGVRQKLLDLFKLLGREVAITALVVDHDPRFVAQAAGRTIVMNRGALMADGPTSAVLNDPRVIESFLGTRAPTEAPPG